MINKKQSIINHFRYSFWIYILIIVSSFVAWDLIYTTTAYRAPEDKKIEWYIADSPVADADMLQQFMLNAQKDKFSDMEEMQAILLMVTGENMPLADVQFSTYIMAAQGDIYLLNKEKFKSYASAGAFLCLDQYAEQGILELNGLDIQRGIVTVPGDVNYPTSTGIYGVPTKELKGLEKFGIKTEDNYLAILFNNKNDENCVKFLNYLIQKMK